MKKLLAILLLVLLLCGCAVPNDASTTQNTQTQEIIAETETPVPDPTPIPDLTDIALLVDIPLNTRVLMETEEDGVYSVALHEDEPYWPTVPIYCWYINGTQADAIDEVVIEFDVLDTVWPLDGQYYGYDQAFYIILHNFDTIPAMPPWPDSYISFRRGDIDRNIMIRHA